MILGAHAFFDLKFEFHRPHAESEKCLIQEDGGLVYISWVLEPFIVQNRGPIV